MLRGKKPRSKCQQQSHEIEEQNAHRFPIVWTQETYTILRHLSKLEQGNHLKATVRSTNYRYKRNESMNNRPTTVCKDVMWP